MSNKEEFHFPILFLFCNNLKMFWIQIQESFYKSSEVAVNSTSILQIKKTKTNKKPLRFREVK